RWGVAADCEISAASRTTWLDVGFALSVGAVVDALWKHELAPGAALCIVATISFAISPPGGGALRAFSAALLAVGCIWRWQELGERQALILYEPLWLLLTAVGLVVHIAASAVRTPAAGGSLLELPGGVQQ